MYIQHSHSQSQSVEQHSSRAEALRGTHWVLADVRIMMMYVKHATDFVFFLLFLFRISLENVVASHISIK